jgi:hypothetical protein
VSESHPSFRYSIAHPHVPSGVAAVDKTLYHTAPHSALSQLP